MCKAGGGEERAIIPADVFVASRHKARSVKASTAALIGTMSFFSASGGVKECVILLITAAFYNRRNRKVPPHKPEFPLKV